MNLCHFTPQLFGSPSFILLISSQLNISKRSARFLPQFSKGIVEQLASDASTSDEEHFRLSLVQLDVERAKWLLRAYLRSRLDKVSLVSDFESNFVQ